jgi:hypothetical protein
MRGPPGRYNVQPPVSLTRPEVRRGPRFTSTGPRAGTPAPHLIRFPLWEAGHSVWGRVQSRCAMGSGGTFPSSPAQVPMVRKADAREMRWRPGAVVYTVQRSNGVGNVPTFSNGCLQVRNFW